MLQVGFPVAGVQQVDKYEVVPVAAVLSEVYTARISENGETPYRFTSRITRKQIVDIKLKYDDS